MGRIPNFRETVFPQESMPILNLTATLGLILFLFLVGLEVDMRLLLANYKIAVSVSAAGMVLPFGFGRFISLPFSIRALSETLIYFTCRCGHCVWVISSIP